MIVIMIFYLDILFIMLTMKKYAIRIYTVVKNFLYAKLFYFIGGQLNLIPKSIVFYSQTKFIHKPKRG